jgi:hypothetical protein
LPATADSTAPTRKQTAHIVRVLRQGSELEYFGEIVPGAAQELRAVMDANPKARVIHLNSEGGSVLEARRISVLIHQANLIAISDTYCFSACTFAFLGARERYLTRDGALGFHHESNDHATAGDIAAWEKLDEEFMADLGIPAAFITKAFAAPANGLWVPTARELMEAKVIAGLRGDFAMTGYSGKTTTEQVDSILGTSHILTALKTADGSRYEALRAAYVEAMDRSVGYDAFSSRLAADTNAVVNDYLIRAGDDLVLAYVRTRVDILRQAVAQNPAGCRLVSGGSGGYNLNLAPGSNIDYSRTNEASARAIVDGARTRTPPPGEAAVGGATRALHLAFRARHADEVATMSDLDSSALKPGAACSALADYLDTAFTLPAAEALAYLRHNYATQVPAQPRPSVTDLLPKPRASKQSD